MALKAGRVGVRKDQVDVHGKINSSGIDLPVASADTSGCVKVGSGLTMTSGVLSADGYTLPKASASALGGVKAVTKTEAMTKEVGIDADGKLYVEPSSGGGVEIRDCTPKYVESGSYCKALIFDNICFLVGEVKIANSVSTYNNIVWFENIPALATCISGMITPLYIKGRGTPYNAYIEGTDFNLHTRGGAFSNISGMLSFMCCYPVGNSYTKYDYDFTNITGCTTDSILSKVYNSKYIFFSGNIVFDPALSSTNDKVIIDSNYLEDVFCAYGGWLTDNTSTDSNAIAELRLDDTDGLTFVRIGSSNTTRTDGCSLFIINEEEES